MEENMNGGQYHVRIIVTHPNKPEWGPGKVQAIKGNQSLFTFRATPLPKSIPGAWGDICDVRVPKEIL